MISLPSGTQIWIAAGVTDLRRGFTGLSAAVQTRLELDPFGGQVFVFRGRRGDLIKVLWWDGDGLCLFAKRLERGRFVWPKAENGTVSLSRAQLSMLLEGIDWRSTGSSAESTELADLSGLMRARNRRTLPGCRFGPGRVGDKPGAAPQGVAAHNHGCLVTQADSNKQL
jgi:transposase